MPRTLQPLEKRVERLDHSAHFLTHPAVPHLTAPLITFVDVTTIVHTEQHQRLLVDKLNHRVEDMLTVGISLGTNTSRRCGKSDWRN